MATCNPISECGRISVQAICVSDIYQGEDIEVYFQFFDSSNNPLDLTQYNNIKGVLYGELEVPAAVYTHPRITDTFELFIEPGTAVGEAYIKIPSYITSGLPKGSLFIEFKLVSAPTTGGETITSIISCIHVSNVKHSIINTPISLPIPIVSGVTSIDGLVGDISLTNTYVPFTGTSTIDGTINITGNLNVDGVIDPKGLILIEQEYIPREIDVDDRSMIWMRDDRLMYSTNTDTYSVSLPGDNISTFVNDVNYINSIPIDNVTIELNTYGELSVVSATEVSFNFTIESDFITKEFSFTHNLNNLKYTVQITNENGEIVVVFFKKLLNTVEISFDSAPQENFYVQITN